METGSPWVPKERCNRDRPSRDGLGKVEGKTGKGWKEREVRIYLPPPIDTGMKTRKLWRVQELIKTFYPWIQRLFVDPSVINV